MSKWSQDLARVPKVAFLSTFSTGEIRLPSYEVIHLIPPFLRAHLSDVLLEEARQSTLVLDEARGDGLEGIPLVGAGLSEGVDFVAIDGGVGHDFSCVRRPIRSPSWGPH